MNKINILFFLYLEYSTKNLNTFDQLCINYTNERLQKFFVDLMLSKEKHWYDSQAIEVPFVEFFDNGPIIGMNKFSNNILCIVGLMSCFLIFNCHKTRSIR